MKLGSLFGNSGPAPLERPPIKKEETTGKSAKSNVAKTIAKKPKPGEFNIDWGKPEPQQVKNYKAVLQLEELEEYLKKCVETGYASFDWETAASDETRAYYEPKLKGLETSISHFESVVNEYEEKGIKNIPKGEAELYKSYVSQLKTYQKEHKDL